MKNRYYIRYEKMGEDWYYMIYKSMGIFPDIFIQRCNKPESAITRLNELNS